MNRKEQVLAVVVGEKPDVVPVIHESFMDVTVRKALGCAPTGDIVKDEIALAKLLHRNNVSVGAEMAAKTLEQDDEHHLYEYESGARWEAKYKPNFCREAVSYPVNSPEDIDGLQMPDMQDPARYEHVDRELEAYGDTDFFIQGCMGGMWSGSYYFCTSFDNMLLWMAAEPEAAHAIFEKVGNYVLAGAEELLKRGVDAVFIYDDLGTGTSLLFSPEMYREFIKPWHKKLADLCHSHGKLFHMHSHGHIQDLMDDIVEAGIDILNPVGPTDNNDLAFFMENWGDKITLLGGISTTIAEMDFKEIEQHIAEVMAIGCKGGRFMPRTESGIPMMPAEKARFFIDTLYKYRVQYGAR